MRGKEGVQDEREGRGGRSKRNSDIKRKLSYRSLSVRVVGCKGQEKIWRNVWDSPHNTFKKPTAEKGSTLCKKLTLIELIEKRAPSNAGNVISNRLDKLRYNRTTLSVKRAFKAGRSVAYSTVVTCAVSNCTAISGACSIPVTSDSCLAHPLVRCLCGT